MNLSSRSAWLLLATVVVLALFWTLRREYAACDLDGCVAIDRWTGRVYFEPVREVELPVAEGVLVRAVAGPAWPVLTRGSRTGRRTATPASPSPPRRSPTR
jgi:hypothetical protein